jgi:hypothetical protein
MSTRKKEKCINCGQFLISAPDHSDYTWTGVTDGKDTCYADATLINGSWISNADHCTEREMA